MMRGGQNQQVASELNGPLGSPQKHHEDRKVEWATLAE